MTNAKHLNGTTRWGTPKAVVDRARLALGGHIGLDPMSEEAFQRTVQAQRYFTEQDDAFAQSWACDTMLINPDGRFVTKAWDTLVAGYETGVIGSAIWIGFSTEQLCILAGGRKYPNHPLDYSVLFLRRRIPFVHHKKASGADMPDRPSHGNYICALGVYRDVFEKAFEGLGKFFHGDFEYIRRDVVGVFGSAS